MKITKKRLIIIMMLLGIFVASNAFGDDGCVNSIDKCKVKVGKNDKGDRIKFTGFVFATEADFIAAIGDNVIVTIASEDNPDLSGATFTFPIEEDTLKNGKYKSAKVASVDKSDPVTSFKVDTTKGKMKFSAKNVDLAGLSCPITVTIHIGDSEEEVVVGGYRVVDTGQVACYDSNGDEISCPESGEAFAGQDAQYDGNQPSFTDNGDGTILDTITGLMWQQVPVDNGFSLQEAIDYCESLVLGGYDDWRIPTTKEMFSISNFSQGWPYLDTVYFDMAGMSVSKDEQYWTEAYVGTTVEGGSNAAFGVNHGTGHIKAYPAETSGPMGNYVRAVRGSTYGVNDFEDNGDGTISDHATGLMWQQTDSGSGLDWENALLYAENLSLADHSDWRLPNVKELQSIVDYTHSPSAANAADSGPAIDTDFFDITALPSGTTNYSPDYGYCWTSTSAYFGSNSPEYYYAWYVAFGTAVDGAGDDMHGAGGVRFDTKVEGGPLGEGGERYYNYVRCVRDIVGGDSDDDGDTDDDGADFEPTDWTEETHSKSADPNFTEVFDDSQVKRFDIVVTSERWQSMLDDMTEMYGEFGDRSGGADLLDTEDPIFVPAEIFYNDIQWYRVGIRFKGNSSLQSSWQSGILKLPFKLDFDEYEDDYPQIKNQRFYGFKKFSLKSNYDDESFLREKVSCDIFKDAGLAVSHTAFYELYVDHGDGPEYFGLYTLVEEVDNTVIKTQFSDDNGNLYKPEDTGASFVDGTFNEIDFEKKTNEDDEDWTDIQALFSALHDTTRTSDPTLWRTNLELVFATDIFLEYLAINTVIQNWDQYGRMTQNYYLYNNPDTGKLVWIPWDYNEALQDGKMGGGLQLDFSDLAAGDWPLIEYLYADDVYRARYDEFVEEIIEGDFATDSIQATYAYYEALIEPYATSERTGYTFLESSSDFQQAISGLNQHAASRASAVDNYLNH